MNFRNVIMGAVLCLAAGSVAAQDVAVRAQTLYTMAGTPISDGVVLVRGGKIAAVGPAAEVAIPEGVEVLQAAVATPGLIDAHSVVGLAGYMNQPHDQDQLETSSPTQPQLRAIDAYNAHDRLVQWVREFGVTTLHTGHGPGALVSGQTMLVKTRGNTVEAAMLRPRAMLAASLGPGAMAERGKSPGTRAKQMALLRSLLIAGQASASSRTQGRGSARLQNDDPTLEGDEDPAAERLGSGTDGDGDGARRLEREVVRAVLDRRLPLLVSAWQTQDIMSALRLKEEFDIDLVIDGGAEAYLMLDALKAAQVPVILHPTMARQSGELENASWTTAARLHEAGIPFALQSGYEGYVPKTRVVLWEAAIAAANGLGREPALASITIDAARILRIDRRVGSLEVGKDGDIALFDGDPFEYTSRAIGTVIDGQVVSRKAR
ncbi:MAG: amidohydrolase family protein [Pseudoxanthomonas suwonensis]|nr:amidohydrolase family protein [Pseudoxanthomonas suwonensis]